MEVPSPVAGKVAAISVREGERVSEGVVILTVEADGAADAPAAATPAPAPAAAAAPAPVTDAGFGKAYASPSVRAFARQLGIDIAKVNGSGHKGRMGR